MAVPGLIICWCARAHCLHIFLAHCVIALDICMYIIIVGMSVEACKFPYLPQGMRGNFFAKLPNLHVFSYFTLSLYTPFSRRFLAISLLSGA